MPLWTGQPLAYPTVQKTGAAAFFPVTNALKLVILGAAVLGADTTTKVAEQVRGDPPTPEK